MVQKASQRNFKSITSLFATYIYDFIPWQSGLFKDTLKYLFKIYGDYRLKGCMGRGLLSSCTRIVLSA
jgi:hypothetical protein